LQDPILICPSRVSYVPQSLSHVVLRAGRRKEGLCLPDHFFMQYRSLKSSPTICQPSRILRRFLLARPNPRLCISYLSLSGFLSRCHFCGCGSNPTLKTRGEEGCRRTTSGPRKLLQTTGMLTYSSRTIAARRMQSSQDRWPHRTYPLSKEATRAQQFL